eukprot:138300_1
MNPTGVDNIHSIECNGNLEKCQHIQRLSKTFQSNSNIHINFVNVIDDFMHCIMKHHYNDNTEHKHMLNAYFSDKCKQEKCEMYQRNNRNRSDSNGILHLYKTCDLNPFQQQILDKIHCFFCHYHYFQQNRNHKFMLNVSMDNMEDKKQNNESKDYKWYDFGFQFVYKKPEHSTDKEKNDDMYIGFVSAKYPSLKNELTHNKIAVINIEQYNNEYSKAQIYFNSRMRKQKYSSVKLKQLLTIMMYCNYDHLSYEFSKTYRRIKQTETKKDVKNRHSEFCHTAKHLKQICHSFGTSAEAKHSFYHGVNEQLLFVIQYKHYILGPLSTSTSFEVAVRFAGNNQGLVVEFASNGPYKSDYTNDPWFKHSSRSGSKKNTFGQKKSQGLKFFPCHWLSDFPNEWECLFLQETETYCNGVKFMNIINCNSNKEYKWILRIIYVFEYNKFEYLDDNMQSGLFALVSNELDNNTKKDDNIDEYGQKIFHHFCNGYKSIELDCNKSIKSKIPQFYLCDDKGINLDTLHTLFPNIKNITVGNLMLSADILENILSHFNDHNCHKNSELKSIAFEHAESTLVSKYKVHFGNIEWDIVNGEEYSTPYMELSRRGHARFATKKHTHCVGRAPRKQLATYAARYFGAPKAGGVLKPSFFTLPS